MHSLTASQLWRPLHRLHRTPSAPTLPTPPQLYQPMPIMIWIAAIVEGAIENWADMGILLGIQFINATLGW